MASKQERKAERLSKLFESLARDAAEMERDLLDMEVDAQMFEESNRLFESSSTRPALFQAFIAKLFYARCGAYVRRACDRDGRAVSLIKILKRLQEHAGEITLDWWMQEFTSDLDEDFRTILRDDWREKYVHSGTSALSCCLVAQDIRQLECDTKIIRLFVNQRIAHLDRRHDPANVPLPREFVEAVTSISEVYRRYTFLISNKTLAEPSILGPWQRELRQALAQADG